jgi:hypothetical protein
MRSACSVTLDRITIQMCKSTGGDTRVHGRPGLECTEEQTVLLLKRCCEKWEAAAGVVKGAICLWVDGLKRAAP